MSLAAQLKRLQILGKSSVEQLSSRTVSLLFDLKSAASLSNDAVLDIGCVGFKELQDIDPIFNKYETYLFSKKCLYTQRNMLTQIENDKLHTHISEFLILLSPYLLLKGAQKSLEWLVRRFQIQIHEKDELLACILPYHDTQLFGRIIQLFDISDRGDSWCWLLGCQKDSSGFSTAMLVNQCLKDRNLLSFICKMASSALETVKLMPKSGLKVIFSFYARILVSVVETCSSLKEDFLLFLMPQIYSGFTSGLRDYVCSSYMIVALISTKVNLKKEIKRALLTASFKFMSPEWYSEGLLSLITLVSYQDVKKLSPRTLKALLSLDATLLCKKLQVIHEAVEIFPIINCLLVSLTEAAVSNNSSEEGKNLLQMILNNLPVTELQVAGIVRTFLQAISGDYDGNEKVADVLKTLAIRYSVIFDSNLAELFKQFKHKKEKTALKNLSLVVQRCLPASKNQLLEDTNIPLVLSLNHPDANIRLLGVQQLFSDYESHPHEFDEEFIKDAIKARLQDNSAEVVNAALKYPQTICNLVDINDVVIILISLLKKGDSFYSVNELILATLNNLGNGSKESVSNFVYGLFGQLLYALSANKLSKLIQTISSACVNGQNVFLNGIVRGTKQLPKKNSTSDAFIKACDIIISNVVDEITNAEKPFDVLGEFWNFCSSLPASHHLRFMTFLLFAKLIKKPRFIDIVVHFDFVNFVNQASLSSNEVKEWLKNVKNEKATYEWLLKQYYGIMKERDVDDRSGHLLYSYTTFLSEAVSSLAHSKNENSTSLFIVRRKLFSILSECSFGENQTGIEVYRFLLQLFITSAFPSKSRLLDFLCEIYQCLLECYGLTEAVAKTGICALLVTRKLLSDSDTSLVTATDSQILFAHMCLLSSPHPVIRETAVGNIEVLCNIISHDKVCPWEYILPKCLESKEEILLDSNSIKRVFQNLYSTKDVCKRSEFAAFISSRLKKGKVHGQQLAALKSLVTMLQESPAIIQLNIVQSFSKIEPKHLSDDLVPIATKILANVTLTRIDVKIIIGILNKFEAAIFTEYENAFHIFMQCLHSNCYSVQKVALEKVTSVFYDELTAVQKLSLLKNLLQIITHSSSINLVTNSRIILKNIHLKTDHLCQLFQDFCNEIDEAIKKGGPVNDNERNKEANNAEFAVCKPLTELLEAIANNNNVEKPNDLALSIFKVLEKVLDMKSKSVEYIKQLLLSVMVNITSKETFTLPEDKFSMEILMQCLQTDGPLDTSQVCLRLLSNAAKLYPTCVLHHVMHIFSFMGKSLIRIDNEQSFTVMEKTIDAVVPALTNKHMDLATSRKRTADTHSDEVAMFILETFVDSIPHCPEHRRLHIFHHLIGVLNTDLYLHWAVILLIKSVLEGRNKAPVDEEVDEAMEKMSPITLDFCMELLRFYPAISQVNALEGILLYLNTINQEQDQKAPRKKAAKEKISNDNKLLHYTMMTYVMSILQSEKIVVAYDFLGKNKQANLTSSYMTLLEKLFAYAQHLNQLLSTSSSAAVTSKLWQKLVQKTYDVLGIIYSLLPFDSFVLIISDVLVNDNQVMKKKSLEVLCEKIENVHEFSCEQKLKLVTLVEAFTVSFQSAIELANNETPINLQLMLYATKLLGNKLITDYKERFVNILPTIVSLYSTEGIHQMVAVNAMLCVAELCKQLREAALQHLPLIINPILRKIQLNIDIGVKQQILLLSGCLTSLHITLKSLPLFMSSFMKDILHKLAICDNLCVTIYDVTLANKIRDFKEDIGELVPTRALIPAIERSYDEIANSSDQQLLPTIVDVYRVCLKHITKEDANTNFINTISDVFLKMFEFRSNVKDEHLGLVIRLEDHAIEAFCDLVLKLSENTLRPMYLQIFSWSTQESGLSLKLITFYRLSAKLSKCLKSLFLLFAGHILKKSTEILLEICQLKKDDIGYPSLYSELLEAVVDTLSGCFQYDTQGFVDKEKFNFLMQPLVDQLDVSVFADTELYATFLKDHLSPCLVTFAAAVTDTACWKLLNHQILLKTKSSKAEVRLAALHVIGEIYNRIGESYMILVPETIPFLAESLEDDSTEVERKCQDVIKQIEEITGESLQKYF